MITKFTFRSFSCRCRYCERRKRSGLSQDSRWYTLSAILSMWRQRKGIRAAEEFDCINKFLGFVESHLNGKKFLVGESASIADFSLAAGIAVVLTTLGEEERKAYPNTTAWDPKTSPRTPTRPSSLRRIDNPNVRNNLSICLICLALLKYFL